MYERILVPTDGSEAMDDVIDHAAALAAEHDATLHTIYVANTASLSDIPMDAGWEGITDALQREGKRAISVVENVAESHGVSIETAVREGSPAKEIQRYATEEECDILVMGTHGRSGVDRLLLGSVTERIVRTSPIPVLTIRVNQD